MMFHRTVIAVFFSVVFAWSGPAGSNESAMTAAPGAGSNGVAPDTESLIALARQADAGSLSVVSEAEPINGVRRQLVRFTADKLLQYALLLTPPGDAPIGGWPLLLFNHGYHPDPPAHGMRAETGARDRPGDYYRGLPQAYAERGFVVVAPDFRGHAESEGGAFTRSALATHWYVRDAIQAFKAATRLPQIDRDRAYMAGHSMGAYITLRAALALGDALQRISLWSPSGDDPLTYFYSLDLGTTSQSSGAIPMELSDALNSELTTLGLSPAGLTSFDRLASLRVPVLLQHGRHDQTTPLWNSLTVASRLRQAGLPHALFIYDTDAHLLTGEDRQIAIERDVSWFTATDAESPF